MENWIDLAKKTYIVTGGSSGIGDAIVKELLANGANVVDADLNPSQVNENHLLHLKMLLMLLIKLKLNLVRLMA